MSDNEPSAPEESLETHRDERGLLALRLGEARFGLWVDEVLEIVPTPPLSRLPLAAVEVAGVTGVRGEIVPVLDLGVRLLGVPALRPGRLVLVRGPGDDALLGMLVDDVETLVSVTDAQVGEAPAPADATMDPSLIRGVAVPGEGPVITILDLARATARPELERSEE